MTLSADAGFVSAFGDRGIAVFHAMDDDGRDRESRLRLRRLREIISANGLPPTMGEDELQAAVGDMMTVTGWQLRRATDMDGYRIESLPHEKFFLLPAILLVMHDAVCQFCIGRVPGMLAAMVSAAGNIMVFGMDRDKWYQPDEFFAAAAAQHDNLMAQDGVAQALRAAGDSFYAFLETGAPEEETRLHESIRCVLGRGLSMKLEE